MSAGGPNDRTARGAVCLERATPAHAPLLGHLLELYLHDMSEFFPIAPGEDGRFGYEYLPRYWSEPDRRHAFVVRRDGAIAGFVLATRGSPASEDPAVFDVAEFFVLRRERRSGVGRAAAFALWRELPGRWIVRVSEANRGALPFWRETIREAAVGGFEEETMAGDPHDWRVFRFSCAATR